MGGPRHKVGDKNTSIIPKDPRVLKLLQRVNFNTGSTFGTEVAKRYGEGSEMLLSLDKRGRKTVYKQ